MRFEELYSGWRERRLTQRQTLHQPGEPRTPSNRGFGIKSGCFFL